MGCSWVRGTPPNNLLGRHIIVPLRWPSEQTAEGEPAATATGRRRSLRFDISLDRRLQDSGERSSVSVLLRYSALSIVVLLPFSALPLPGVLSIVHSGMPCAALLSSRQKVAHAVRLVQCSV